MGLWKARVSSESTTFIYSRSKETSNQQEKVTGAPVLSSWLEPTTHAQEPTLLPLSGYNTALYVELLRPSLPRAGQSIWPHQRREERKASALGPRLFRIIILPGITGQKRAAVVLLHPAAS